MEHLLFILALLILARLLGWLMHAIGQPAIVGEIGAGMLIAIAAVYLGDDFPFLTPAAHDTYLPMFASLGIFFVILASGVEMQPRELTEHSGIALTVALGGMVVPLASGIALGWAFLPDTDVKIVQALLIGTAMSVSAIPVTARVLMDFKLLHSLVGKVIISAAVIDDVLALMLLAVLTSLIASGEAPTVLSLTLLLVKVAGFFAIAISIGMMLIPRLFRWFPALRTPVAALSCLILLGVLYALLAEALGMHFVLGPFIAGLYFDRASLGDELFASVDRTVSLFAKALFGPIFFASIGLALNPTSIMSAPLFVALLLLVAFAGKFLGAGVASLACGLSKAKSTVIAISMNARGGVGLVVVQIAAAGGLFAIPDPPGPVVESLYHGLVLTVVLTTIATPLLLRLYFHGDDGAKAR